MNELNTIEKIEIILKRKNMTKADLADALKMSRQNLSNKLKRGNLTQSDLEKIATAMHCEIVIDFKDI